MVVARPEFSPEKIVFSRNRRIELFSLGRLETEVLNVESWIASAENMFSNISSGDGLVESPTDPWHHFLFLFSQLSPESNMK
jgi:hypothetical protein